MPQGTLVNKKYSNQKYSFIKEADKSQKGTLQKKKEKVSSIRELLKYKEKKQRNAKKNNKKKKKKDIGSTAKGEKQKYNMENRKVREI